MLINREQCIRMEVPTPLPPYGLTAPNGLTIVPKVSGDVILGHQFSPETADLTSAPVRLAIASASPK